MYSWALRLQSEALVDSALAELNSPGSNALAYAKLIRAQSAESYFVLVSSTCFLVSGFRLFKYASRHHGAHLDSDTHTSLFQPPNPDVAHVNCHLDRRYFAAHPRLGEISKTMALAAVAIGERMIWLRRRMWLWWWLCA